MSQFLASEANEARIKRAAAEGSASAEIGLFVRPTDQLVRARTAVEAAGHTHLELSERLQQQRGRVAIGAMHLAKGLEYKISGIMACDDNLLLLPERIETVADEYELDAVHDTERNLFTLPIRERGIGCLSAECSLLRSSSQTLQIRARDPCPSIKL